MGQFILQPQYKLTTLNISEGGYYKAHFKVVLGNLMQAGDSLSGYYQYHGCIYDNEGSCLSFAWSN